MPERDTSRRDFLHGKSVAEALRGAGPWAADAGREAAGGSAATMTLSRRAMACEFQVRLPALPGQNDAAHALAALDAVEDAEDRITTYRETSEVVELNAAARYGPAPVAPDIFALLELAHRLHADTGGAFDITAGPLSEVWGFTRRRGRLPSDGEIAAALARVGWGSVRLDREERTLAFGKPGMAINFNSSGKGFALDGAAGVLSQRGVGAFLLHGGRSTLLARGAGPGGLPWGIGLRHPQRPSERIAECRPRDASFSTSGSRTQCFVHNGRRYGHLIDPRTGRPAEGLHSVSVVAPTAAEADALSTALYVMGPDAGAAYCRSRPDVQALFVVAAAAGNGVMGRGVNLDPACWRLAGGGGVAWS